MLPQKGDVIFSTDMYNDDSIKSKERQRRGESEKRIIAGECTKRLADWKLFLSNDENKQQFIQLLTGIWSSDSMAKKVYGRKIILVCEGTAIQISSEDGASTQRKDIVDLKSSQEETDSRVILYSMYGQETGYEYIKVKSPDSDVFFILLHFASKLNKVTLLFDTGSGNKRRLINITDIAKGSHRTTALHS